MLKQVLVLQSMLLLVALSTFGKIKEAKIPVSNGANNPNEGGGGNNGPNEEEQTQFFVYQVQFTPPPVHFTYLDRFNYLILKKEEFFLCAGRYGIEIQMHTDILPMFNGFFFRIREARDADILEDCNNVIEITPDVTLYAHSQERKYSNQQTLGIFGTQFNGILNMTKKAVKVGIVDTGVDYLIPSLQYPKKVCTRVGQEGCKVKMSRDVVKYVENLYFNQKDLEFPPTEKPYSTHGTMIATLIAGENPENPVFSPTIDLYDYRVLNPKSSAHLSIVMQGIHLALKDNVQIICVALGTAYPISPLPDGPILNSNNEPVTIITSIGNGYAQFYFQPNALGISNHVISVGSTNFPNLPCVAAWIARNTYKYSICFPNMLSELQSTKKIALVHSGFGESFHFPDDLSLSKYIVVFLATPSSQLLSIIADYFPWAIVICNYEKKEWKNRFNVSIPLGFFMLEDQKLHFTRKFWKSNDNLMNSVYDIAIEIENQGDYTPSRIQASGPTIDFRIKPDVLLSPITYSGSNLFEATFGPYDIATSHSAAYVTKFAAFFMVCDGKNGSKPSNNPSRFKDMLLNTAEPLKYKQGRSISSINSQFQSLYYPVPEQGAGRLRLPTLLTSTIVINPSKINLGHASFSNQRAFLLREVNIEIYNPGPVDIQYRVYHLPSASISFKHSKKHSLGTSSLNIVTVDGNLNLKGNKHTEVKVRSGTSSILILQFYSISYRNEDQLLISGYLQFVPKESLLRPSYFSTPDNPVLYVPYLAMIKYSKDSAQHTWAELVDAHKNQSSGVPWNSSLLTINKNEAIISKSVLISYYPKMTRPVVWIQLMFSLKRMRMVLYSHIDGTALGFVGDFPNILSGINSFPKLINSSKNNNGWDGSYLMETMKEPNQAKKDYYHFCLEAQPHKKDKFQPLVPIYCTPAFLYEPKAN